MKILHVCLACFYVEGMGYQENILPKIHAEMGHEVEVVASDFSFNSKGEIIKKNGSEYVNKYGVHVKILHKTKSFPFVFRYGEYGGLYCCLEQFMPDIIFVHGGQFVSLSSIIKYCKKHRSTRLYIDQHGDYYNMPCVSIKEKILQKVIYGHYIRKSVKYCNKYWGVTPWRCAYLHDVYGIPQNKIELLVMGGDTDNINFSQKHELRKKIRFDLGLKDDDFIIITGGKIDKTKNIHLLMQAVAELNRDDLKLIVFGQPNDKMSSIIDSLSQDPHIRNIGWVESSKVYDYFLASDLAVFPGTHSVLWEQAAACGVPLLVKDWKGMHHIDVGGNCQFLKGNSIEELKEMITKIYTGADLYKNMLKVATEKGRKSFSYQEIAKQAIEENIVV